LIALDKASEKVVFLLLVFVSLSAAFLFNDSALDSCLLKKRYWIKVTLRFLKHPILDLKGQVFVAEEAGRLKKVRPS
jgi:hypothetical protein